MKKNKILSLVLALALMMQIIPMSLSVSAEEAESGDAPAPVSDETPTDDGSTPAPVSETPVTAAGAALTFYETFFEGTGIGGEFVLIEDADTVNKTAKVKFVGMYDKTVKTLSIPESFYTKSDFDVNTDYKYIVTEIGGFSVLDAPNLTEVLIPSTVTKVGNGWFDLPKLDLFIPNTVIETTMGVWDFSEMNSVTIEDGSTAFNVVDDVIYSTDGTKLIYYPRTKTDTTFTLPADITTIGFKAFADNANLTEVVLSDKVTEIDSEAFSGCTSLSKIDIPASVTTIYSSTFSNCESLDLFIPKTVTEFSILAAQIKELNSITFEDGSPLYKEVDGVVYTADGTQLIYYPETKTDASFDIPDTVTTIAYSSFEGSKVKSVDIPDSVESIGWSAFANSDLEYLYIPDSVKDVYYDFVMGSENLTAISIPNLAWAPNFITGYPSQGDPSNLVYLYFRGNYSDALSYSVSDAQAQGVQIYYKPGATGWEAVEGAIAKDMDAQTAPAPKPIPTQSKVISTEKPADFGTKDQIETVIPTASLPTVPGGTEAANNEQLVLSVATGSSAIDADKIDTVKQAAKDSKIDPDADTTVYLDINLFYTGKGEEYLKVQPNGTMTIFVPYSKIAPITKDTADVSVIHMKSDNTTEVIKPTMLEAGISFDVSSLSPFLVGVLSNEPTPTPATPTPVPTPETPTTGDDSMMTFFIGISVLSLLAISLISYKVVAKKKSN